MRRGFWNILGASWLDSRLSFLVLRVSLPLYCTCGSPCACVTDGMDCLIFTQTISNKFKKERERERTMIGTILLLVCFCVICEHSSSSFRFTRHHPPVSTMSQNFRSVPFQVITSNVDPTCSRHKENEKNRKRKTDNRQEQRDGELIIRDQKHFP